MIAPALLAAITASAPPPVGDWVNPARTLTVRTEPCGQLLCGRIVAASPTALADASDAGIPSLIGTSLLQDYKPTGAGTWQGRVYVPDMGGTYFSRLTELSPNQIRISGCILGGLLCKSQVWTRQ